MKKKRVAAKVKKAQYLWEEPENQAGGILGASADSGAAASAAARDRAEAQGARAREAHRAMISFKHVEALKALLRLEKDGVTLVQGSEACSLHIVCVFGRSRSPRRWASLAMSSLEGGSGGAR